MKRTLEMIENDLANAREELKPLQEAIGEVYKKVNHFYDELEKYKLDNKLYYPMSDLKQYIGYNIYSIKLVERNEDETLIIDEIYKDSDGNFEVDENGYLDYASMQEGIMHFDENIGKYIMWYHYSKTEHNYVGFLEISAFKEDI